MNDLVIGSHIDGVRVFELKRHEDERGSFQEVFNNPRVHAPLGSEFVQDNVVRSTRGVLRGMHFQQPDPQGKLVTVIEGEVFDAIVDLRKGSPTFGKWSGIYLSEENGLQVYVPKGCAHGYLVLSDNALVFYKCTSPFDASASRYLKWDDPDVGIEWPIDSEPVLSEKDKNAPLLEDLVLE